MGNCFVVEAALTLWGVCAIDFVQAVVQVESTRSKSGKRCILRRWCDNRKNWASRAPFSYQVYNIVAGDSGVTWYPLNSKFWINL